MKHLSSEEIDAEVLRQVANLLDLFKRAKEQGKAPSGHVSIAVDDLTYRLEATPEVLQEFLKKYKAKDRGNNRLQMGADIYDLPSVQRGCPRTLLPNLQKLPRYNPKDFTPEELEGVDDSKGEYDRIKRNTHNLMDA